MKTIGFIGLGLIGGSIAKTIRKFHPDYHILAYAKFYKRPYVIPPCLSNMFIFY